MKKKILLTLVIFMFMTMMSIMLIPKTYAAGVFSDDGWIYDSSNGSYTITKEDADVETSGYSDDNIPEDPFYLKLNPCSSDLSYYAQAVFISTEDTAVETQENGVVRMGLVPYYLDSQNFVAVYMNWENSQSSTSMSNVHVNGRFNGQWFDYDYWIHDNSNYPDLHVNSNNREFDFKVRVYGSKLLVEIDNNIPIEFDLSDTGLIMTNLYDGKTCSMIGLYGYGSSIKAMHLSGSNNVVTLNYHYQSENIYHGDRGSLDYAFGFEDVVVSVPNFSFKTDGLLGFSITNGGEVTFEVDSIYSVFDPIETHLYAVYEETEEAIYTSSEYHEYGENQYNYGYNLGFSQGKQSVDTDAYYQDGVNAGRLYSLKEIYWDIYSKLSFEKNTSLDIMSGVDFYNTMSSYEEGLIEYNKLLDSIPTQIEFLSLKYIKENNYYSSEVYNSDVQTYWNEGYSLGLKDGKSIAYHEFYTRIYDVLDFDLNSEMDGLLTPEEVSALNSSDERYNEFIKLIDEIPEQLEYLNSLDNEEISNSKYEEGYTVGVNSVDITTDNDQAIQDYILDNNYHSNAEYLEYGSSKYEEGYTVGAESIDITTDNDQAIEDYISDNNYHSNTEYLSYGSSKYQEGYTAGANSVDITSDNDQAISDYIAYMKGHGYLYSSSDYDEYGRQQYNAGVNSVDITIDNEQAIQDYISDNNYHSDEEYLQFGENKYQEGYVAGANSVDITTDNDTVIVNYIKENNYHSNKKYLDYGSSKFEEGKTSVDVTVDNQTAIDDYITNNKYHSNTEYIEYGNLKYQEGYQVGLNETGTTDNVEPDIKDDVNSNVNDELDPGVNADVEFELVDYVVIGIVLGTVLILIISIVGIVRTNKRNKRIIRSVKKRRR